MMPKSLFTFCLTILITFVTACSPGGNSSPATATLEATLTQVSPTPTPTEILPTLTPTALPQGPCENFIYPLQPGNQWAYQVNDADGSYIFHIEVTDITNNYVGLRMFKDDGGEISIHDEAQCVEEVITDYPFIFESLILSDYLDGIMNTFHMGGIIAPDYETYLSSNGVLSWEEEKITEEDALIPLPSFGVSIMITISNSITLRSQSDGILESVTVQSQTYLQAIKIQKEISMPVTVGGNAGVFLIHYTEWVQPYIGIVKIAEVSAGLRYSQGVEIPMPIEKSFELVGFSAGE